MRDDTWSTVSFHQHSQYEVAQSSSAYAMTGDDEDTPSVTSLTLLQMALQLQPSNYQGPNSETLSALIDGYEAQYLFNAVPPNFEDDYLELPPDDQSTFVAAWNETVEHPDHNQERMDGATASFPVCDDHSELLWTSALEDTQAPQGSALHISFGSSSFEPWPTSTFDFDLQPATVYPVDLTLTQDRPLPGDRFLHTTVDLVSSTVMTHGASIEPYDSEPSSSYASSSDGDDAELDDTLNDDTDYVESTPALTQDHIATVSLSSTPLRSPMRLSFSGSSSSPIDYPSLLFSDSDLNDNILPTEVWKSWSPGRSTKFGCDGMGRNIDLVLAAAKKSAGLFSVEVKATREEFAPSDVKLDHEEDAVCELTLQEARS